MDKFNTFIQKHGEAAAQALLESWERVNGVTHDASVTLERRWELFLLSTDMMPSAA